MGHAAPTRDPPSAGFAGDSTCSSQDVDFSRAICKWNTWITAPKSAMGARPVIRAERVPQLSMKKRLWANFKTVLWCYENELPMTGQTLLPAQSMCAFPHMNAGLHLEPQWTRLELCCELHQGPTKRLGQQVSRVAVGLHTRHLCK